MTRDELDRLAELEAKATPGPWDVAVDSGYGGPPRVYRGRGGGFCVLDADHERAIADARLIVRLRNAAPTLLTAAREAEELKAWIFEAATMLDFIAQGLPPKDEHIHRLLARV